MGKRLLIARGLCGRRSRAHGALDALDALTHRGDGPDGLPGSDDRGTMSAFYVFAALGLYPVAGTDRYVLGSPLFPPPRWPSAAARSPSRRLPRFPRAVMRNGAPSATVIHHGGLAGATLHYDLQTAPIREPATP